MSSPANILFVDDEPNILSGMRRTLRSKAGEWAMTFAESGEEALKLLDGQRFDAVVTDMRMPRMDGAELLEQVGRRWPEAVRIILSGQCDREAALRAIGPSHIFISKPCEPATIVELLDRSLRLRRTIYDPSVRRALGGLRALPSIPKSYHAIAQAIESPHCSSNTIADLIAQDPAVTAALLHVANSAYFAPRRPITSIAQAVQYLGIDVVRAVLLSSSIFSDLAGLIRDAEFIAAVWDHSLRTAARSRAALKVLSPEASAQDEAEAYTCGLLHDIGILALRAGYPAGDPHVAALGLPNEVERLPLEQAALGVDHAVVGAFLMGTWGLPDTVVEAIAFHHDSAACFSSRSPFPRAVALACFADNCTMLGMACDDLLSAAIANGVVPGPAADPQTAEALRAACAAQS